MDKNNDSSFALFIVLNQTYSKEQKEIVSNKIKLSKVLTDMRNYKWFWDLKLFSFI